jgi:hypothetical protein
MPIIRRQNSLAPAIFHFTQLNANNLLLQYNKHNIMAVFHPLDTQTSLLPQQTPNPIRHLLLIPEPQSKLAHVASIPISPERATHARRHLHQMRVIAEQLFREGVVPVEEQRTGGAEEGFEGAEEEVEAVRQVLGFRVAVSEFRVWVGHGGAGRGWG